MGKRGELTPEIAERANTLMGRPIDQVELRLMPNIQFVMTNYQRIDPRKINLDERRILQEWRCEDRIEGGASGLSITKEFWDIICELIFLAYVDID